MREISFTVYGKAEPKQADRSRIATKHDGSMFIHHYQTSAIKNWEEFIRWQALSHHPETLWDGAIEIEETFYFYRPKSAKNRTWPAVKPDQEQLSKAVRDALQGLIYTNDSRIVRCVFQKLYGDPPRVEIKIRLLE